MESRSPSQPAICPIAAGMPRSRTQRSGVIVCSELIGLFVDKLLDMDEVPAPVAPCGAFRRRRTHKDGALVVHAHPGSDDRRRRGSERTHWTSTGCPETARIMRRRSRSLRRSNRVGAPSRSAVRRTSACRCCCTTACAASSHAPTGTPFSFPRARRRANTAWSCCAGWIEARVGTVPPGAAGRRRPACTRGAEPARYSP